MSRKFHLGCVLSITTGRLLSPKGVDGLYEILNYMTGDDLFTHALPRASKEACPHILRQHPQLADVDASGVGRDNWKEWLAEQVAKYGEELELSPIAEGEYTPCNPLDELSEMVGDKSKIVVVVPPEHE